MLQTCDLLHTVNAMLYAVFEVQTKHVITSLSNEKQSKVCATQIRRMFHDFNTIST